MKSNNSLISKYDLTDGAVLYSTSTANILIGCPPEILKLLMHKHFPMPNIVVIPGTLYKDSSSQACLEFPFYHFLFIQQGLAQGKKFKVLAKKDLCDKLSEMLRVTLLGPEKNEILEIEKKLKIPQKLNHDKISQIIKETHHLALKAKDGHIFNINELVEFIPFETGDSQVLFKAFQEHPEISIQRKGEDSFVIECGKSYPCDLKILQRQSPPYEIKGVLASEKEKKSESIFSVRCLGTSEGFDPTKPANGVLLRINGKWILWDCPAYLRMHLEAADLKFDDVSAIFISHVHEDHLDITESIQPGSRVPIYTSPEIFYCMLLKLMAVLNCSFDEAQKYYDFHPVYANEPLELFGAKFEIFYSVHAIPALGLDLSVPNKDEISRLYITGDTLSKRMIKQLADADVFSKPRLEEVNNFLPTNVKYDIVFTDSGGGIIHGDPQDYFDNPNPVKHMHTGNPVGELPDHHQQAKPGQRFVIHN
ncbi:MAG: hypothetical protein OEY59_11305 [Deltaproteobacteria bacterium]|nr:hypothetical protein [Deltaproteobacteria bacterium]